MDSNKIGKYWVKLRSLRHDYIEECPEQDIRTMSREDATKYKHRGNWFQCAKTYLELTKHEIEINDKALLNDINIFLNSEQSSARGERILDSEVAQADAVLDNTISYLESIAS